MSGRIVKLRASPHQATQELLTWFALDRLSQEERTLVREHLQSCAQCQSDADFLARLNAADWPDLAADHGAAQLDVERTLAKLRPRLRPRGQEPERSAAESRWGGSWRRLFPNPGSGRAWMPWALGTQFAVIAGLCALLWQPALQPLLQQTPQQSPKQQVGAYSGLGAGEARNANVVVVFRPDTSELEMRRILRASGARLVDGPTVTNAYLLDVGVGRQDAAVAQLHAEPAVTLAESLESP